MPWAEFDSSALSLSSPDTAPFGLGLQPSNTLFRRLRNQGLQWFFQRTVLQDIRTYTNEKRAQIGLPPSLDYFFDRMSPCLYLLSTVPEFRYPRRHLPPQNFDTAQLIATMLDLV
ncbi:hypothetical protein [Leptolyngbya ohadii]|uniref:hypothetical protein n=1 Tax=Leptolyngbya ohadii TaxID=1962290 RepID=UPI000B59F35F|nr:hypothetical protein [Leptolyngbya ohadii]